MKRAIGIGAVLSLFLMGTPHVIGKSVDRRSHPRLTVVVCDKAGVDRETRLIAKQQATRILGDAGVDLAWIDLESDERRPTTFEPDSFEYCPIPSVERYFLIVITAQSPRAGNRDLMGLSYRNGENSHAYVLFSRVKEFVSERLFMADDKCDAGVLLGHVIVHELGHLLMPGVPHSLSGIMRANWGTTEGTEAIQGTLLFHPNHARLIQERLERK